MKTLLELQDWYLSQCNDDWEHAHGICIETMDNPGWSVKIALTDTHLVDQPFQMHSYGIGKDAETSGDNWLVCKVENEMFLGYGGPTKLQEILERFLHWAKKSA